MNEILNDFDWESVHTLMESVDWRWGDKVPSINEMIELVKGLFEDLDEEGVSMVGTGGFYLHKHNGSYTLHFSFETSHSE